MRNVRLDQGMPLRRVIPEVHQNLTIVLLGELQTEMRDRLLNAASCRLESHQEEACREMQKMHKLYADILQVRCEGNSMFPTLRNDDILFADRQANVRAGDIVVYSAADGRQIVHRLIAIREQGLLIQGDNNCLPDTGFIGREQLLGKVLFGFRGRKTINCPNGKAGMLRFRLLQTRIQAKYHGKNLCRGLYRLVTDRLFFCRFFGDIDVVAELSFKITGEVFVTVAGRVAARRTAVGDWSIWFPYRLLFDEQTLKKFCRHRKQRKEE